MSDQPVRYIPTDEGKPGLQPGLALCLAGGGYRAMLFHLGALWRLNEARLLPKLQRISCVSGGSITAGVLALRWAELNFVNGLAEGFTAAIVPSVRALAGSTIDAGVTLGGVLLPGSAADRMTDAYQRYLFGNATLQALPDDPPRFVFNATNVQSGVLWRFSKPYMGDYRVGLVPRPNTLLAAAVAASSAFPPVLSPVYLDLLPRDFTPGSGTDLQHEPYTSEVVLTDGGVYDNLALETAWKRYQTILVSDGCGKLAPEPEPKRDWEGRADWAINLIHEQLTSLRKRQLIEAYKNRADRHDGAYWGIGSDIGNYELADALPCPPARTLELARTPTQLKRLEPAYQERLINWGYAICDAALRKHLDPPPEKPAGFPYPDSGV